MTTLTQAFINSLAALMLCLAGGLILRRRNIISDAHVDGLSQVLIRLGMPSAVLVSLMREFSRELLLEAVATIFITAIVYVAGGYLGFAVARLMRVGDEQAKVWCLGVAFSNAGFMGIPVTLAVFGPDGLIYASMAVLTVNLLAFAWGPRVLAGKGVAGDKGFAQFMKSNPLFPAAAVGLVLFVGNISLPYAVRGGIYMLSTLTSPLSMIMIGAVLARQSIVRSLTDLRVLPPVLCRLLVVPLATYFVLGLFIPNTLMQNAIVLLMAMPTAAATVIVVQQHGQDSWTAAKLLVMSTCLSAITVALVLWVMQA